MPAGVAARDREGEYRPRSLSASVNASTRRRIVPFACSRDAEGRIVDGGRFVHVAQVHRDAADPVGAVGRLHRQREDRRRLEVEGRRLATVIAPVVGSIAKAPAVLPPVIAKMRVSPSRSASVRNAAVTVPTGCRSRCSPRGEVAPVTVGRFVGVDQVHRSRSRIRPRPSVACTVSEKLGVVSKSSAAALATVIAPVDGSIANPPPVFPP